MGLPVKKAPAATSNTMSDPKSIHVLKANIKYWNTFQRFLEAKGLYLNLFKLIQANLLTVRSYLKYDKKFLRLPSSVVNNLFK